MLWIFPLGLVLSHHLGYTPVAEDCYDSAGVLMKLEYECMNHVLDNVDTRYELMPSYLMFHVLNCR
jgi:hypothetical protein